VVEATIRRVKDARVRDRRTDRVTHACLAGERLLAFSSAISFRSNRPVSLSALGSVRATSRRAGGRIVTTVRSGLARPQGMRVDVQIHAVCVRGPS